MPIKRKCENPFCTERIKDRRTKYCSISCAAKVRSSDPKYVQEKLKQLMDARLKVRQSKIIELLKDMDLGTESERLIQAYYKIYRRGYVAGYCKAIS